MNRRTWLGAGVAVIAIVAGFLAWDALVVTDEERIETLVPMVTGSISTARVNTGMQRWIDLERQPFEVSAMGQSLFYGAGEEEALRERANAAVRELRGTDLRPMQTAITVEGDEATVRLRLLGRGRGMGHVEWRLARHGHDWLLERVAVTR